VYKPIISKNFTIVAKLLFLLNTAIRTMANIVAILLECSMLSEVRFLNLIFALIVFHWIICINQSY